MSDYTPTMRQLREEWITARDFDGTQSCAAEWDNALAAHNADVAATVLEQASDWIELAPESTWARHANGTNRANAEAEASFWLAMRAAAIRSTVKSEDEISNG